MKLKLLAASLLSLIALTSASYGDTYFNDGFLSGAAGSPTSHVTGQSTVGTAIQYYNLYQIAVTTSGTYTFELASVNTTGTPSNALDTWLAVFTGIFNPVTPGAPTASNDDFTGSRTVLPGPYAGTVPVASTGFTGASPGSRIATVALTAGTTYSVYVSSFRDTSFVGTGTTAQPTGPYWLGIGTTGAGAITVTDIVHTVPEPSTVALVGLIGVGAVALGVWRKRKVA